MEDVENKNPLTELNMENFEKYIGVGTSKEKLLVIFQKSHVEMDKWAKKTYHLPFSEAYAYVLEFTLAAYKDTIKFLATSGNATALNIMAQMILKDADDTGAKINVTCTIQEKDDR